MFPRSIVISDRAFLSMTAEAHAFADRETGGIFLGAAADGVWHILEVIDPGYLNTVRNTAYFEYDQSYVTHLANVKSREYKNGLKLLGLWHRHPGSFDRFSPLDDQTNARFAEQNGRGALSALVNFDPDFRMTFFHVSIPLAYQRVKAVTVGDACIPAAIRALKRPEDMGRRPIRNSDQPAPTGLWRSVRNAVRPGSPPPEAHGDPGDLLMEMLETELDVWLERQADYAYDLKMESGGVRIDLRRLSRLEYAPARLHCRLTVENGKGVCRVNGAKYPYSTGVIKGCVEEAVARNARTASHVV